jgi:hypothetical protein
MSRSIVFHSSGEGPAAQLAQLVRLAPPYVQEKWSLYVAGTAAPAMNGTYVLPSDCAVAAVRVVLAHDIAAYAAADPTCARSFVYNPDNAEDADVVRAVRNAPPPVAARFALHAALPRGVACTLYKRGAAVAPPVALEPELIKAVQETAVVPGVVQEEAAEPSVVVSAAGDISAAAPANVPMVVVMCGNEARDAIYAEIAALTADMYPHGLPTKLYKYTFMCAEDNVEGMAVVRAIRASAALSDIIVTGVYTDFSRMAWCMEVLSGCGSFAHGTDAMARVQVAMAPPPAAPAHTSLGKALLKVRDTVYAEPCASGNIRYRMTVLFTHSAAPEHVKDSGPHALAPLTKSEFLDMLLAQ